MIEIFSHYYKSLSVIEAKFKTATKPRSKDSSEKYVDTRLTTHLIPDLYLGLP